MSKPDRGQEELQPPLPEVFVRDYVMSPNETAYVDLSVAPLEKPAHVKRALGIRVPQLATISASTQEFSLLDTRETDRYTTPFLLVAASFKRQRRAYKGVWEDELLTVGRAHHRDRFKYHGTVSSRHFSLLFSNGELAVLNGEPTNETRLRGNFNFGESPDGRHDVRAVYTQQAVDDLRHRHDYGSADETAPYGYFRNHQIIGRKNTTLKGGVYFTTDPKSEAVVVDDKSEALRSAAEEFLAVIASKYGQQPTIFTARILREANDYTRTIMPYNLRKAERLSAPHNDNNGLIGLSDYIKQRAGVCRHQCLLAAFLLETLIDKNLLVGKIGVERNHDIEAHGAHAWAIFETPDNKKFVLDPAQNFVGTKEEAARRGRWKYHIPD